MTNSTLRDILSDYLKFLHRNLEVVSLEELKTKYYKPYLVLQQNISNAATDYVKDIVLGDLHIHHHFIMEVKDIIESVVQESGLLKQIAEAAFYRQDIKEIEQLALTLKKRVENILAIYYEEHLALCLLSDYFEYPGMIPFLYNEVTGCILQNRTWIPLDVDEKIYVLPLRVQKHTNPAA